MDESSRRIEACVECEIPLPLLRPLVPEDGEGWVCSFCGCQYHAEIDESLPEDIRNNVRRAD